MDKQLIERIAKECYERDEFRCIYFNYRKFLARIAAERGKDAVAWLHESRREADVITTAVKNVWGGVAVGNMAAYSIPLFLSPTPTIPERLSLYLEPALISAEHAKWEAATILADDDPSYDTFCGGWKAALKLIAAQGERNAD